MTTSPAATPSLHPAWMTQGAPVATVRTTATERSVNDDGAHIARLTATTVTTSDGRRYRRTPRGAYYRTPRLLGGVEEQLVPRASDAS